MGSAGSALIHWGYYPTDTGSLPLEPRLLPLHELNLMVTAHHTSSSLDEIQLETINTHDLHSLIKAYAAYHAMHAQETDGAGTVLSPRVSREALAHRAKLLAVYFQSLARELEAPSTACSTRIPSSMPSDRQYSHAPANLLEDELVTLPSGDREVKHTDFVTISPMT